MVVLLKFESMWYLMESMVKLDSKGRILIPINLRKKMGIVPDNELILMPGKIGKVVRIMPICNENAAKCTVMLSNSPGGLSNVMGVLEMLNVSVLLSKSRNFIGNGTSEWTFILDTSQSTEEPKMLEERLATLESVKSATISTEPD